MTPKPTKTTLLVLINPNSGTRTALTAWETIVKPLCEKENIHTRVIITSECLFKPPGHKNSKFKGVDTTAACKSETYNETRKDYYNLQSIGSSEESNRLFLDIFDDMYNESDAYFGVCLMSGDGSLFEMLNYLERNTEVELETLRIAILPCGTSEGLSTCIYNRLQEKNEVAVIQELAKDHKERNFCCFQKAADTLTSGANEKYQRSLRSNVPFDEIALKFEKAKNEKCFDPAVFRTTLTKVQFAAELMMEALLKKETRPSDAYRATMKVVAKEDQTCANETASSNTPASEGNNSTLDFHHTCWGIISDVDLEMENPVGFARRYIPKFIRTELVSLKHIASLKSRHCRIKIFDDKTDEPVVVEEGSDFYFVSILNCNYIDNTLLAAPGARYDDGYLHVVCLRGSHQGKNPINALSGIQIFGQLENGRHFVDSGKHFCYYRTRSKLEITVGGAEDDSHLDICGNGEKPFENCYGIDENQEFYRKNVGMDRCLTCRVLPGYLNLILPKNL